MVAARQQVQHLAELTSGTILTVSRLLGGLSSGMVTATALSWRGDRAAGIAVKLTPIAALAPSRQIVIRLCS